MKYKKSDIVRRFFKTPELKFEDPKESNITSFSGLIVFQNLFKELDFKNRLKKCFGNEKVVPIIGYHTIFLWLIIHIILGYRRIRDVKYYEYDPMVLRTLGLSKLPYSSTFSRSLNQVEKQSVSNLSTLLTDMVSERIEKERLARLTLDFDGSVISTTRHAQGSAVGYNKKKKGQRSYYPLFCTIAQTGQFFDLFHRPGNVHDSNGSIEFVKKSIEKAKTTSPQVAIETRMDSAFFNEDMLENLDKDGVEFTISVPFERFTELKELILKRKRWRKLDDQWSYFENSWKPKSWKTRFRFVFIRQKKKKQIKGPLQLDLFEPRSFEYDYKVIVTNKKIGARKTLKFHNGRGSQEGIFAEAKTDCKLEYVPVRSLEGNKFYCLAAMFSHNLNRELHLNTHRRDYNTTEKRRPLWIFQSLGLLRKKIIQRAGKLIRPQGKLTLVIAAEGDLKKEILNFLPKSA